MIVLIPCLPYLKKIACYLLAGVDLGNPRLDVNLQPGHVHSPGSDSKEALFCDRVKVSGLSRLKLASYSNSLRVTLVPSAVIPERLHRRIQVCFHRNVSIGWCHCGKEDWKSFQNGQWSSLMSPYGERYIDVKAIGEISGRITVQIEEEPHRWRLLCLAVGLVLLFLAPVVSSWVPFYYSSSMAIGIILVIVILLFQGMKLLPTGRKNILYLSIYGSVLGAGTIILHHISELINSILLNFGLDEEMHNPVYIFVLVGIILAGAALGYWMVRKFVISKDGNVDSGVAQFVKWSIRAIATTFLFQVLHSTTSLFHSVLSLHNFDFIRLLWSLSNCAFNFIFRYQSGKVAGRQSAEFYRRAAAASSKMSPGGRPSSVWANSPVKGLVTSSPNAHASPLAQQDYYSTFHKTAKRKKYTKKEWDEFTRESTKEAMKEWASSPEVASWLINNADRIQLLPSDCSSEEITGSESDSTGGIDSSNKGALSCLFSW
ncbi:hypothetical protein LINPERPRIM_LOCUS28723 [Linum perenne]